MIKDFVKAWDVNKDKLKEYLATHEQNEYSDYKSLVSLIFEHVINPWQKSVHNVFDLDKIHEINDGDYQGTLLYLIPRETYQPSQWDYVMTNVGYGSCSGCDTLLGISGYESGLPTEHQVKEYVELCLHILQRCTYPYPLDEPTDDIDV